MTKCFAHFTSVRCDESVVSGGELHTCTTAPEHDPQRQQQRQQQQQNLYLAQRDPVLFGSHPTPAGPKANTMGAALLQLDEYRHSNSSVGLVYARTQIC